MVVMYVNYLTAKVHSNFWALLFLRKTDIKNATQQCKVALQPAIKFGCEGLAENSFTRCDHSEVVLHRGSE